MDVDPSALLRLAERLAADAAAVLRVRPAHLEATAKTSPTDAVTVMDRAAERVILDGLRRHRPHDAIVAEESGELAPEGTPTAAAEITWHVDPLDGTVNYLYDLPSWSVSIAAVTEDRTVAGCVLDVPDSRLYTATIDGPARCNGRVLSCSDRTDLSTALIATGFSYRAAERRLQAERIVTVLPRIRDIRRAGSAALDLCDVAAARVDGYFEEGGRSWDWLAGELVASRAGAVVRRAPVGVTSEPLLAAAPPALIDPLWELVKPD